MHELSIVMSILEIARKEAGAYPGCAVEEIEMDIGELSGIDRPAFDFAWQQAVKSTLLENATKKINDIPGQGYCEACALHFELHQLFEPCPQCGEHLISITKGKELRVRSLVLS